MPRFDFLCTDCESTFEHLLPPGGEAPKCLACGSANVEKLLAPPPVIFKGSGFYKTDGGGSPPKKDKGGASAGKASPSEKPASDGKSSTAEKGEKKAEKP